MPWTLPDLRREWNRAKETAAPWWREHSKEAYNSGLAGLADALKNWSASRKGRRKGKKMGAIRVDKSHVVLPRIGRVRTHEPTTALLEGLRATVSREGGRWFVSFTCQVEREEMQPKHPQAVVGVDVGLRHLAVLSTGERVPNPSPLKAARRKIARLNRELARLHAHVANIRRDAWHKLTTRLARTYGTVAVENLNVEGMKRNRGLSRSVVDAALAELRRMLTYKCVWYGSHLVEADRFYPSSKRCSCCGAVKESLPLWERVFRAALAAAVAGSGPETLNARGRDVSPTIGSAAPSEAGSQSDWHPRPATGGCRE